MKSKAILFYILLSFISCDENKEDEVNFEMELQKIILNYQNKVKIPDQKWIKNNTPFLDPKYCYTLSFRKQKQDTILVVQLINNGIFESKNYYGVYKSKKLEPTLVQDENNLSHHFVKKLKNQNLENFVVTSGPVNDTIYPFDEYLLQGKKIILLESYTGNME